MQDLIVRHQSVSVASVHTILYLRRRCKQPCTNLHLCLYVVELRICKHKRRKKHYHLKHDSMVVSELL